MMKDTALLTAFTLVCVGPATVVAMSTRPPPAVRTYAIQAEHVAQPAFQYTQAQGQSEPVLQDPAATDDPATEAVPTDMYVTQAATADKFEVEASKLALFKAGSDGVKRFAQTMIDDHSSALERLKTAASAATPPLLLPETLDQKHSGLISELTRAISGPAFDRAYIAAMVSGHEDAIKLHRSYAQQGDSPALKEHATSEVPIITSHLAEAQKIASTVKGM
jgi:putative membrane protein